MMSSRERKIERIIAQLACECPVDVCNNHGDSAACELTRIAVSRKLMDRELGKLTDAEVHFAVQCGMRYIMREPRANDQLVENSVRRVRSKPN